MKTITKYLAGAAMAVSLVAGAIAADFGAIPAGYENAAEDYMMSRLDDSRGARITFEGEPYQVVADFGAYGEIPAWAVDLRLRSRSASGSYDRYMAYTVIFVDEEPVALASDIDGVEKAGASVLASR